MKALTLRTPCSMSPARSFVLSGAMESQMVTRKRAPSRRSTDMGIIGQPNFSARRVGPGAVVTGTPKNGATTPWLNFWSLSKATDSPAAMACNTSREPSPPLGAIRVTP